MALRYSFDMAAEADLLDNAISSVLDLNLRTPDIAQSGMTTIGTSAMGDAILDAMDELST